jgi:hypothetical protein
MTGFLKCSQSILATALPTTRDHGNHGCVVTLIKSTLEIFENQILFSTFITFSECNLEAISGTTHQYFWWSSICEYANSFSVLKIFQSKLIIQIDVSSHEVSIASVLIIVDVLVKCIGVVIL